MLVHFGVGGIWVVHFGVEFGVGEIWVVHFGVEYGVGGIWVVHFDVGGGSLIRSPLALCREYCYNMNSDFV